MPLNKEQQEAVEKIFNFFCDEDGGSYLLKGSAGTGKTFTVTHIINEIGDDMEPDACKMNITFCAPTHKALRVLRKTMSDVSEKKENDFSKFNFLYQTTARLLRKRNIKTLGEDGKIKDNFHSDGYDYKNDLLISKDVYDEKNKEYITVYNFNDSIYNGGIYIIDECSMIGKEDYQILEKLKKQYNLKILYIGDWAQLAPIDMKSKKTKLSKTLTKTKQMTSLTKTERISNKYLFEIYGIFRNCVYDPSMDYKEFIYPFLRKNIEGVTITTSPKTFQDNIEKTFKAHEQSCVLSYTNKRVKYYNELVKDSISPNKKCDWNINDRIVFNKNFTTANASCVGIKIPDPTGRYESVWEHWPCRYINNNDYGYILDVEESVIDDEDTLTYFKLRKKKEIRIYKIEILLLDRCCPFNKTSKINVCKVFKQDLARFQKYKNKKKNEILSKVGDSGFLSQTDTDMLNNHDSMVHSVNAPFLSAYATTIRKSQGSTYENIFLDTIDLDYCSNIPTSDKARALYTAVSRASKNIFILVDFKNTNSKNNKFLSTDIFKKCSRCGSTKEIVNFVRSNGNVKKTCNNCSFGQRRIRKEKQNNIKN